MPLSHRSSRPTKLATYDHRELPAQGSCIFCDKTKDLASTGIDALGFRAHLAQSEPCRTEYQLWRQVIRDEWLGD